MSKVTVSNGEDMVIGRDSRSV